jgi:DNA-binding NarL/FixJ family response regulator
MSIFVIDDHPLMREAVVMLLRRLWPAAQVLDLERLAQVSDAAAKHGNPELISLDLKLRDSHGVSGVREMRAQFPGTPIVVLSASPAEDYEDLAIEAGADVYIEKSCGINEIASAMRAMLAPDSGFDVASSDGGPEKISKRQKQLLVMLDQGLSNRQIAEQLNISEHTVKVHLWRLFRRLNVKSRTQATHKARQTGLF